VAELPESRDISGMTSAQARTALGDPKYQRAAAFFDSTRVLVTVSEATPLAPVSPPKRNDIVRPWAPKGCRADDPVDDCVRLFHRAPRGRVLRAYVPAGPEADAPLKLRESRLVSMISSADSVQVVAIPSAALGERSLALTFGRSGTITGIDQVSSAGFATAASTLAAALTTARDEFTASVTSVQKVQEQSFALQSAARSARIKELADQKALVEAQMAIDGARAGRELVLQKQQLESQIALLKAQQGLESAQAAGATSAEVAAMRAELERVKAELELLKQRLELEKLRRSDSAHSPPGGEH
jgi:hypothetical protein